jgi:hypothetical protein
VIPLKVVLKLLCGVSALVVPTRPLPNNYGPQKTQCILPEVGAYSCAITVSMKSNPESEASRTIKVVKSDNAPVPKFLWNQSIVLESDPQYNTTVTALQCIRHFTLHWRKQNLLKDFLAWYKVKYPQGPSTYASQLAIEAGRDCITRASNSLWWGWDDGFRPHFWGRASDYQEII